MSRMQAALFAAAGLLFFSVLLMVSGTDGMHGLLGDPDSYMRLAVIEHDMVSGSGLRSYVFPREGVPDGMMIHWTLPFDLMIWAMAAPFAHFMSWHAALAFITPAISVVSLALCALAAASITRAIGAKHAGPWAVAIVAVAPALLGYGEIGKVSHHVPAVAFGLFSLAAAVLVARSPNAPPRLACGCLCRPGGLGKHGMQHHTRRCVWHPRAHCQLASGPGWPQDVLLRRSGPGFSCRAHRPATGGMWAFAADRFSMLQVIVFAAMGVALQMVGLLASLGETPWRRIVLGCVATLPPLALCFAFAVVATHPVLPPDPDYIAYFWNSVAELRPAWTSLNLTVYSLFPGIFALGLLARGAWLHWARPQGIVWLAALGLLGVETLAGVLSVRLVAHGAALSAALLGAFLRRHMVVKTKDRTGLVTGAIMLSFCLTGSLAAFYSIATGAMDTPSPDDTTSSCELGPQTAAAIAGHLPSKAVVASDIWGSPELLWRTDLRTIAGPYHRNWSGISDMARILRWQDDDSIRSILRTRGATALLICMTKANYDRPLFTEQSLMHRLAEDKVPSWLTRVSDMPAIPTCALLGPPR